MKRKNITLLSILTFVLFFTSCSKESDIELNESNTTYYKEDFSRVTQDGVILDLPGWRNFNEVGSKKWTGEFFGGNGSVAFSAFSSGDLINVGWLISPAINMDLHEGEKMSFQSQHNFLRSRDNTLEFFVSTDYDGTNFSNANWINIPVQTPTPDYPRFENVNSGVLDFSKYKGQLHFAFKVKGSGTNSNLTGTYQIDNINIYYPTK